LKVSEWIIYYKIHQHYNYPPTRFFGPYNYVCTTERESDNKMTVNESILVKLSNCQVFMIIIFWIIIINYNRLSVIVYGFYSKLIMFVHYYYLNISKISNNLFIIGIILKVQNKMFEISQP